jgi:drug/metabolite transporter (DMT)-like permease
VRIVVTNKSPGLKRPQTLSLDARVRVIDSRVHSSMMAFGYVSVGAFVVVRNLGPLFSLGLELLVHRCQHPTLKCNLKTIGATVSIAVGVVLYESHDLKFSLIGTLLLVVNLFFTTVGHIVERHYLAVNPIDVPLNGLVLLKNVVGAAWLIAGLSIYDSGQWAQLAVSCSSDEDGAWIRFLVLLSCVVGAGISYAGLWLQKCVSATSFAVISSATKIAVILWGILLEHDASDPASVSGALLSLVGALVYSVKSCNVGWVEKQVKSIIRMSKGQQELVDESAEASSLSTPAPRLKGAARKVVLILSAALVTFIAGTTVGNVMHTSDRPDARRWGFWSSAQPPSPPPAPFLPFSGQSSPSMATVSAPRGAAQSPPAPHSNA